MAKYLVPVEVRCYAGYRGEQRPERLVLEGRGHDVKEILDRWYQADRDPVRPPADYFKVRTGEGETLILKRDRRSGLWYLVSRDPP